MRRGYWTGFLMGGLLGMVAARAYGDRIMDTMFPGMAGHQPQEDSISETDNQDNYLNRPRRRRRYRRSF